MVLANRLDNGNGRGATLEEVARVAGVSRATVSRVVNGNPRVNPDVRRAVERAVDRLGYVPNPAARSLVTRRSQSIGLVIAEPAGRLFEDPFFPRLLRGIGAALSSRDLQLVLLMPQSSGEETRAERYLTAGTSMAPSWSASTATTRCPRPSLVGASRWSSADGRRAASR